MQIAIRPDREPTNRLSAAFVFDMAAKAAAFSILERKFRRSVFLGVWTLRGGEIPCICQIAESVQELANAGRAFFRRIDQFSRRCESFEPCQQLSDSNCALRRRVNRDCL